MRIAAQIPEEEIKNLRDIFEQIDKNGNGMIERNEMVEGI